MQMDGGHGFYIPYRRAYIPQASAVDVCTRGRIGGGAEAKRLVAAGPRDLSLPFTAFEQFPAAGTFSLTN